MTKMQSIVAQSTIEAELVAANLAGREMVWLLAILQFFGEQHNEKPILYCDNQSTIQLISNPIYHYRTKHIGVKFYWIRDAIDNRYFAIQYISTDQQLADIFTKVLPKIRHKDLRLRLMVF